MIQEKIVWEKDDGSWWTCMLEEVLRTKFKNIQISPVHCQQQPIPALWDSIHELWGTVAQARIRRSVLSCRPGRWSSRHTLLSSRTLWYHFDYVFVLIYLIVFITDCFIRKWRTKHIDPKCVFWLVCLSNWFLYLLVGVLISCLVGCLVICFLWFLVGRSVLIDCLVGFSSFWCWLTARLTAPYDHFTPWFHRTQVPESSADHKGWQPGCKWTSQVGNVAHCLGAMDCEQCTYAYDI